MVRVLLGWELGGNSGHARRLSAVADVLAGQGHEVHLAMQRPDALRVARPDLARIALWQAPVWSGLLRFGGTRPAGPPASFGDVLGNLGLRDSGELEFHLRGWDRLIAAIRPQVIAADFAPALLLAARGRIPAAAIGTGFTVPPSDAAAFPAFPGAGAPLFDEGALLEVVNHALARLDRAPLARLPQVMAAEAALPAVFDLLDPYAGLRTGPLLSPFLPAPLPAAPMPGARGVFAYLPAGDLRDDSLPGALAALATHRPVTCVMPGLDPARAARLTAAGVRVAPRDLSWPEIAGAHGLVLCAGGIGTVSAALMAGLPLCLLPTGIEQALTARALAGAGLGRLAGADPAATLMAMAEDTGLTARVRGLSATLRAGYADPARATAKALLALAGRG